VCVPKASFPPRTTTTTAAAAFSSNYLLKVFVVARAIFKRRNPFREDGAGDVLGFLDIAMKDLATHACPHAYPQVTREGRT